jgi:hypothetical protein
MTVLPDDFVLTMETVWTSKPLNNHSSPAFRELWRTMAETYQHAIRTVMTFNPLEISSGREWLVMAPEMGAGKTVGAHLYLAMMARQSRTLPLKIGGLMVCRTIQQCDKAVHAINGYAGFDAAITKHSENSVSIADTVDHPVLVITHNALVDAGKAGTLDGLLHIRGGKRFLTIIDEALADAIEFGAITLNELYGLLALISPKVAEAHPVAVSLIRSLLGLLEELGRTQTNAETLWNRANLRSPVLQEIEPTFDALASAMRKEATSRRRQDWNDPDQRKADINAAEEMLDTIALLLRHWAMYVKQGAQTEVHTAKSALPSLVCPVVLNATAEQDPLIDYMRARVVPTPKVRNYRNLTLKVLRSNGIGKNAMANRAETRFGRLAEFIRRESVEEDRWLVVTHKDTEAIATKLLPDNVVTAHWGALDGLNDFNDCNKAVLFGVSYRNPNWSNEVYYALRGVQPDEWLGSDDARRIKNRIDTKLIASHILQAIGRPRSRRVCDDQGNCLPTTIYLTLPKTRQGQEIERHLRDSLSGAVVEEWSYALDGESEGTGSTTRSNVLEAVLIHMKNCIPGRYPVNEVAKALSFSPNDTANFKDALKKGRLTDRLERIGVRYDGGGGAGKGRGRQAVLIKDR